MDKQVTFDREKFTDVESICIELAFYMSGYSVSMSLKDLETLHYLIGQIIKDCEEV